MGLADTAELSVRIGLDDKLSPGLRRVNGALGRFQASTSKIGKGVGQIGSGFAKAGLLAGGAAVVGLGAAAKAAIDFEDAFQGVVKTVDEADLKSAGLTFEDLSQSIRKMSREMPNSAIELAGIAEQAGALGIKAKDIESFTRQVAILASTTNVSADDAATALGQLQNVIGLTGDEFDNFAASLVDLGNKGASTEAQILEIARRAGGAAKLFGIAKDETLGWAAAAANLGINSELAGTSLQNVFIKLLPKINSGSKALSKVMGRSAKDIKKLFEKDASRALELFVRKLAKLPKDARLDAVQDLFGKGSGITRLLLGLSGDVDNLSDSLDTSADAWAKSTAAAAEFEKRNQTVKSSFARLKNNVLDAAVTIGEGFAPALGRAADKLSKFLAQDSNRRQLKALGEDIGKAIDKIDFDKLLTTAKSLVSALRPALDITLKMVQAFDALPGEIKGAILALAAANKVSGGAISSGIGNVLGGLGESFAKAMIAKVPLFGSAFVQPVFVTNLGAGLPGGGGGTPVPGPGLSVPKVGAAVIIDYKPIVDEGKRIYNKLAAAEAAREGDASRLLGATNAAMSNERSEGAKHRAAIARVEAKERDAIIAFRAGERAINNTKTALSSRLGTANERLAQIRAKKTNFRINNNIAVNTSVSVRDIDRSSGYKTRVARTTSMSAS